jgi:hypothetical protein
MTTDDRTSQQGRHYRELHIGQSGARPAGALVPEPVRETTAAGDGFTETAQGRSQAGCNFPDGAPHPDPRLAAHGWQADHGVWVNARRAAKLDASDREAV